MERFADLHLHTWHSDGVRSPAEVVELAHESGLSTIAISDHDTVAAYEEVRMRAAAVAMRVLTGVELSTAHRGIDVHLLAYRFDPHNAPLLERLEHFRRVRLERGHLMVDRLIDQGFPITRERVLAICGDAAMGRPHIARALIEVGTVATIQDAFDRFLSPGGIAWIPKERFAVADALRLVHDAGGVTSIAHPTLYPRHRQLVRELFELGVDGVEIWHPRVDPESHDFYRDLARQMKRLTTGGSDDHGLEGRRTIGSVRVPESAIASLLDRSL